MSHIKFYVEEQLIILRWSLLGPYLKIFFCCLWEKKSHVEVCWQPSKEESIRLPWWFSGKESACQCRRHGFSPWSGKIPYALKELCLCATTIEPVLQSPGATTTEPMCCNCWSPSALEPMLCNKESHCNEKPAYCNHRVAPSLPQLEKNLCSNEDQHNQK